ncbi:uncharacterized protein PFB0145c-like [Limulus polyphemus]|uniref:Uncharacterized protein PFB0145c-like n=1 Tax=Limulus polyphemus TaxID=6850 RepID=A0ABM1T5N7_LIMPO|nr:uncharacterized protein PFB0145c-like [Limulus polyphemus]
MGDVGAQNLVLTSSNKDRPQSNQLSELHVYLVPNDRWIEKRRLAINQVVDDAVSSGFVRVLPTANLTELRKVINDQLGQDVLPKNYLFLRSVGRNFTQVKPHQEKDMKTKNYMPPFDKIHSQATYVHRKYRRESTQSNNIPSTEKGRQGNREARLARHTIGGQPAIGEGNALSGSTEVEDSHIESRRRKDNEMNYKVEKRETWTRRWNSEGNYSHEERGDEDTNYKVKDMLKDNRVEGGVNNVNERSHVRRTNSIARSQSKNQTDLHNKKGIKNNNKSKMVQNNDGIEVKKRGRMQGVSSKKYKTSIPKKTFHRSENNVANSISLNQTSKDEISTEENNHYSPKINQSDEYVIENTSIKLLDADGSKASDNEIGEIIQYIENEERNSEVESGPVEIRKHVMTSDNNDPDSEEGNKYITRKTVTETREERTEKRSYKRTVNGDMVPMDGGDGQRTIVSENRKELTESEISGEESLDIPHEEEKHNFSSTSEGSMGINSKREPNQTQRGRLKIEVSMKELGDTIIQTDDVKTENKLTETEAANTNVNTDGEDGTREMNKDFHEAGSDDGKIYKEKDGDLTKPSKGSLGDENSFDDRIKNEAEEYGFDDRTRTNEGFVDDSIQNETEGEANLSENSETVEKVNNDAHSSNFKDAEEIVKDLVKDSSELDLDGLQVEKLHDEESVAGGATDEIGGEIKNRIDNDFEKKKKKKGKFPGSSDNSGETYGWAVDGNGKRWYYRQKKPKTKREKDVRNTHRAKTEEADWAPRTSDGGSDLIHSSQIPHQIHQSDFF